MPSSLANATLPRAAVSPPKQTAQPARDARLKDGISVSIVSHQHGTLVADLLQDLAKLGRRDLEVLLTVNVPEEPAFHSRDFPFSMRVLDNERALGFAENHNRAAAQASRRHLCILNPDVRLPDDPFDVLVDSLSDEMVGVSGPLVVDSRGVVQDTARRFPTLRSLLRKLVHGAPTIDYESDGRPFEPDWIAGVCMMFRTADFRARGGFDDRYFLYYEDVDLCARLRANGERVLLNPASTIVHDARRRSWKDPYYAALHLRSMVRFFGVDPKRRVHPIGDGKSGTDYSTTRRVAGGD